MFLRRSVGQQLNNKTWKFSSHTFTLHNFKYCNMTVELFCSQSKIMHVIIAQYHRHMAKKVAIISSDSSAQWVNLHGFGSFSGILQGKFWAYFNSFVILLYISGTLFTIFWPSSLFLSSRKLPENELFRYKITHCAIWDTLNWKIFEFFVSH